MPKAIVKTQPPPVPGLDIYELDEGKLWEVSGSIDALEAAGCDTSTLKVPAIIERPTPDYGIPLYPFQREGTAKMAAIIKRHGGGILGDEMGLGKTLQAAVIGEYLRGDERALVVCPAGVRHQWEKWAATVMGGKQGLVVNLGPPSEKAYKYMWDLWMDRRSDIRWGIVSYALMDKALTSAKPRIAIFDEIHTQMQGRANKYVKLMWKWGALIQYKLALTGSPYLSEPKGLWQVLNVLLGMRFGRAEDFDFYYCNAKVNPYGGREVKGANKDHVQELRKRLMHYMVRREKAAVADQLPKVTHVVRWVEGNKTATAALANAQYTSDGLRRAMEPTLRDKIPAIVDYVEEVKKPCVIFCWRRVDCEMVSAKMEEAGLNTMVIHGEYAPAARAAMVAKATKEKCHVITTYGASSTGLDGLQHLSSNYIAHAIEPVIATVLQSIARLDRIGQTEPVTAAFFAMRDSVDELIVDKAIDRIKDYQAILGQERPSELLREALIKGGLGDLDNDAILQAIFDDIT